jgi:TolB protein
MKQNARVSPGLIVLIVLVLFLLNLSALAWIGWPALQERGLSLSASGQQGTATDSRAAEKPTASQTPSATLSATPIEPAPTAATIFTSQGDPAEDLRIQGVLLLSIRDGEAVHLFAYHPGLLPLTRLTQTNWDEIDPAVSPDGRRLAYASRQNGYWDLYIRDLVSGAVERITDTPEYEGRPSWSPDGQWLVCAGNTGGNLDIYLISLTDRSQAPIRLTEDQAADTSPAWSPQGRQIAFVTTRNGRSQIWIADLDRTDEQRVVAPMVTVITAEGSAVPLITGVLSLVRSTAVGLTITGALGGRVSTVKERRLGALMLPDASAAVTDRL